MELEKEFEKRLTIKEAYDAMLYMLEGYYNLCQDESAILTIIGAGGYQSNGDFLDSAFFEYYLDAIEKVKKGGPPKSNIILH